MASPDLFSLIYLDTFQLFWQSNSVESVPQCLISPYCAAQSLSEQKQTGTHCGLECKKAHSMRIEQSSWRSNKKDTWILKNEKIEPSFSHSLIFSHIFSILSDHKTFKNYAAQGLAHRAGAKVWRLAPKMLNRDRQTSITSICNTSKLFITFCAFCHLVLQLSKLSPHSIGWKFETQASILALLGFCCKFEKGPCASSLPVSCFG